MADIMDFLGPMMPRRPTPGLTPPHPASGVAPDIMQILAEAATLHPPREGGPDIERIVNNPNYHNVNGDALAQAIIGMGISHGGHGSFPGLTRALIDELTKAHLRGLDVEAELHPTVARMLLQHNQEPDMMSLMALDDPSTPQLSSYFQGHSATDNPDAMIAATNALNQRMQQVAPQSQGANADALLERFSRSDGPVDPTVGEGADKIAGDSMDQLYNLVQGLRQLAMASQKHADPAVSAQLINNVVDMGNSRIPDLTTQALIEALHQSKLGSGYHNPTLDPTTSRSLAPDINPHALGYGMLSEGQDPEALTLLMQLMGLQQTRPRRNV